MQGTRVLLRVALEEPQAKVHTGEERGDDECVEKMLLRGIEKAQRAGILSF